MPNWCNNSVTFRHEDPEQIARVVRGFQQDKLFGEFLPCPQELLDMGSPLSDPAQIQSNMDTYGASDWYSWCRENWGTKWDVNTDDWDDTDQSDANQVVLSFDTAWQPPVAFYEKMTQLGFDIEAYYLEEGAGFVGKYTSTDGDDDYNFDGAEDLDEIPDDIRQFWDLDGICEQLEQDLSDPDHSD